MLDSLGDLKRTHYCGALRGTDAGRDVVLMGWVHRRRDLGNLIFIDLRDRTGLAQIVFNKEQHAAAQAKAEELRAEYVVAVQGKVVAATEGESRSAVRRSGSDGLRAAHLEYRKDAAIPGGRRGYRQRGNAAALSLSRSAALAARAKSRAAPSSHLRYSQDDGLSSASTKSKRPCSRAPRPKARAIIWCRAACTTGSFMRCRNRRSCFKQILMIGGLDRYFQIVRCFRDEDLRADRQPEFTQLDVEMSFPRQEDVFGVIEKVMVSACAVAGITATAPFRHMQYRDAIRRYGSDKPDLRFGMELHDVTKYFDVAKETLHIAGSVFAMAAPNAAQFSRKQLDELGEKAKALGARGVYTAKVTAEGVTSSLEKNLGAETLKHIAAAMAAKPGDLIVAVTAKEQIPGTDSAALIAGQLRLHLADRLGLVPKDRWEFLWLTGFPLFEWSETEKSWASAQHPFTGIIEEDVDLLENAERRGEIRSKGYDLVLNGVELGSGSIRIHRQDIQSRVFRAIGLTDEQARSRFGFFLDALSYGTPPHGGIALGSTA